MRLRVQFRRAQMQEPNAVGGHAQCTYVQDQNLKDWALRRAQRTIQVKTRGRMTHSAQAGPPHGPAQARKTPAHSLSTQESV